MNNGKRKAARYAAAALFLAGAVFLLLAVLVEPMSDSTRYLLLSIYGFVAGGVLAVLAS